MISVEKRLLGYRASTVWPLRSAWGLTKNSAIEKIAKVMLEKPQEPYRSRFSDPSLYDPNEEW